MSYDETDRVAFWVDYMDRSYALAEEIMRYPLAETGEGFASIPEAMQAANVEVQFSTTKIGGQFERLFYIRASLIPDLIAIGRDMNARGWILKIEDGYRTAAMQTALGRAPAVFDRIIKSCIRECGGRPPVDLVFRRAMPEVVANVPATGTHLCGAAVDISVYLREDGSEVWRGKPYLEMSEYTPMDSPFVNAAERANRLAITAVMERHGFMHYPGEFWHYNKGDAYVEYLAKSGKPARYGAVSIDTTTGKVTPLANPKELLTPVEEVKRLIEESLARGA